MTGKRLSRQLKSIFGDDTVIERLRDCQPAISAIEDKNTRQNLTNFLDNLPAFFSSIEIYYEQLDDRVSLAQKNMDMSSQELADNNARLTQLNRLFETMVNSLGQGFFLFDRDGFCPPIHSKACEVLLDKDPSGLPVSEVLGVPREKREAFNDWCQLLFDELVDFEDLVGVGPKTYPNPDGRIVTLEYKPVRNAEGRLEMVLVIATDRTAESKARLEAQKMHSFAILMVNIVKDKDRFRRFVAAVRQIIRETYQAINKPNMTLEALAEVKRHIHTVKGAAGTFGIQNVQEAVHALESKLGNESDLKTLQSILCNDIPEIDRAFEGVLDEHREILSDILVERVPSRTVPIDLLEDFALRLKRVQDPKAQKLYREFMEEIFAIPLKRVFEEFDAVIQQVAEKLAKRVDPIRFIGDDVSVMPDSIDALRSALIHVFRNIVDHGIEHEIIRDQRGKPAAGQVVVEFRRMASESGPYLRIIINDDGNGIDIWQIRNKMEKRGLSTAGLTNRQMMNKIFDAGFSTASAVTEFSGRGVGLDAVKTEVERLGGTINVRSDLGEGSAFVIEIPLDESGNIANLRSADSTSSAA